MDLQIIEHCGQRVLTTSQLAESYGTESKIISRNYQRNAYRYIEGRHFFALSGEELRRFKGSRQFDDSLKFTSILYLWTEKGAWLHAKSLNTEKSWEAYEMLVDRYYKLEKQLKVLTEREKLEASMRLSLMNSEDVKQLKNEVQEIRSMVQEQITLDHGQQMRIKKAVAAKIYEISNDKAKRTRLFAELYRDLKDRFGVASYRDIKKHEMLKAIGYIEAWIPKKEIAVSAATLTANKKLII
ncbi:ORF6N domain-containing protein [Heyndrickxia oleronia]|jgi:ribosomal protein L17|uniref:ORF6N domain-containing protein n=1 Tax=Heyndrickxia oleronia TaxID=38875 RepID=UPI00242E09E0|nr:ORF6N domain-containing protein [Heyndrickxia oleronia]MCI1593074.1 ORF6N domain-containing protein [Heyndrickxia oleronia]MCI1615484.1 ORF6N domain-containing protein [Heyndrickxia oleronia]MCI1746166.1 ORF6N domain-containing protein [Heyndrickxia oleronia]MCI1763549.1 ORF6N domain-containing protein [Heyndrickxia oleronia]